MSFALIAKPCSWGNERNSSTLSPLANLRALEAIRRKITAAKARVCCSGMCQRKGAFAQWIVWTIFLPLDRSSLVFAPLNPSEAYPVSAASSCRPSVARPGTARCCRTTAAHRAAVPARHAHLGVRLTSFSGLNERVCWGKKDCCHGEADGGVKLQREAPCRECFALCSRVLLG